MVGDELGEPVDLAVAHLQHPPGVLEHRASLQPPEGDDLGDAVASVFGLDVADDFVAMRFAEIDVEVGHRHALGVEEALEQQAQRDRIEIGDGQRPGDDRASARAAARPDRDVVGLGPFDEVGDDQEIAGKAHAGDDVELELEAFEILLLLIRVAAGQTFGKAGTGIAAQLLVLVVAEPRQDWPPLRRRHCAAPRDHGRVGDRLGQVGE